MPLSHSKLWKTLDSLAQIKGISVSALAISAGLDPTSFNPSKRFGSGDPPRPRWPSTESLMRILDVTGLSLGEFAALAEDAPRPKTSLPLLGLAQAGSDGFFDDAGLPTGDGWDHTDLPQPRDTLFSLRITGDSMLPLYREGDRVIVDQAASNVRKGDRVVVRTLAGETMAKEILSFTSRKVSLGSINPAFPTRDIERPEIAWMARILWVSQ